MSALSSISPTPTATSSAAASGLNTMSGSDFLNLMINQLQHQDPLNPTDSNQLLTQISQISTLQSNTAMTNSLSNLTLQQSIGAGGNLIGKSVTGIDATGMQITGTVNSVKVQNKDIYLELDTGGELPMENIENIATPGTAAAGAATPSATALAAALPQLQQILANNSTNTSNPLSLLASMFGAK